MRQLRRLPLVIDLPTIVEAIRRQRPGVVPEWLENGGIIGFFDARDGRCIRPDCVEAMLVGWLWMHASGMFPDERTGVCYSIEDGWSYQQGGPQHQCIQFGPTTLGCILSLCHAIGIEVADG